MLNKKLFIFAHNIGHPKFYNTYNYLIQNQWKKYNELKTEQETHLRHMMSFAYKNIPYYNKLCKKLKLSPGNFKKIEDLEKLPILNKEIINENIEDFKPVNMDYMKYYEASTGGTSGTPLRYRITKYDRFIAGAILYRGWGYTGYELGDKMVFLAGSSLGVGTKSTISNIAHDISRNLRKLSSFDMGHKEMDKYIDTINSFKPKYIRGYPSAIYFFAKYLEENNIKIYKPDSIYSTSEKLLPTMRQEIEDVFDCEVYDNYGLWDGGVSAHECQEHSGLHIDTERSIMEIVDENGLQIENGTGSILATNLHNYSMPFIRYQTGDMGHIIEDTCGCGRGSKLLKEIVGRTVDILVTPEGKSIHGWFFSHMIREYCRGIKEYQVIQKNLNNIEIKIVKYNDFDETQLGKVIELIQNKSEGWNVEFKFVDKIDRTKSGKYKFIISELKS